MGENPCILGGNNYGSSQIWRAILRNRGTANDPLYIVGNVGFVRGQGGTDDDGVFDVSGAGSGSDALSDAESARDTWFNSNPEILERYTSNPAWLITLVYLVGTTETRTYQRYRASTNNMGECYWSSSGRKGRTRLSRPL